MPFTATHVAAIVPVAWLCRWRLPLSALAIGSMVPDVASFYPGIFDYPTTHSFAGVFTHCLPLGLIGFYLFHLLLKRPLVDLLPPPLSRRLEQWRESETDVRPARMLVVMGCIAVGAITHVVWDAFTHETGWGVAMFPSLQGIVVDYGGRPIPAYAIIQHGSSLVLLPPLALGFFWWAMHQPQRLVPTGQRFGMPRSISWTAGAMFAVGAWIYFQALYSNHVEATWIAALRTTVKHCGAVAMAGLLLYCIGMQVAWWFQSHRDEIEPGEIELDTTIDGRHFTSESAHAVLRSRVPHGVRPQFIHAETGHSPLDPAADVSTDTWS